MGYSIYMCKHTFVYSNMDNRSKYGPGPSGTKAYWRDEQERSRTFTRYNEEEAMLEAIAYVPPQGSYLTPSDTIKEIFWTAQIMQSKCRNTLPTPASLHTHDQIDAWERGVQCILQQRWDREQWFLDRRHVEPK